MCAAVLCLCVVDSHYCMLCPTGRHSVALEPVSSWGAPETSTASKPQNSDTVPDIEGYTAQMRGWEARKLGLVARLLNSGLAVHELGAPSGAPSAMPSRPGTGGLKHKAVPAAFMPTGMATPEAVGPICTRKLLVQALVQESRALLAVFQRGNRRELRGKTVLCVVQVARLALALSHTRGLAARRSHHARRASADLPHSARALQACALHKSAAG